MLRSLKIVFLGTPEFAVAALDVLHHSTHQVVAVVTMPDKAAGRGMQLQQSEVKKYALGNNLPLLQPEKLKNEQFLNELRALNADLFVVVAFRMLPEVVWNMPPMGTINLHASLLPQYRGAAPINWAIIQGEKETGVTTFKLQHEIDTGKIIFQEKVAILPEENVGDLYQKLMNIGRDCLLKTVNAIAENSFPQINQAHIKDIKHAPKLFKEHALIDWSKSATEIHNLIRGLSPYPAAYTHFQGKILKIFKTEIIDDKMPLNVGEMKSDGKNFLYMAANDKFLSILDLQLEGKKRMKIDEFLRGNKIH